MNAQVEKNRLDLAYRRQLSYLNALLLLATIGMLSFISTFIWKKEFLLQGTFISICIFLIVYFWHKRVDKIMWKISDKIRILG